MCATFQTQTLLTARASRRRDESRKLLRTTECPIQPKLWMPKTKQLMLDAIEKWARNRRSGPLSCNWSMDNELPSRHLSRIEGTRLFWGAYR